jgi:hypothetical protein
MYDDYEDDNKPVWPTWASYQGYGMYDEDDDENKSVWPTWAVGIISGVRDVEVQSRGI